MKKIFSIALSLAMVFTLTATAFAAEPTASREAPIVTTQNEVSPRINWSGTAELTKTTWNNITSSNNFFPDSPLITSDSNNPGTVTVRVLNGDGNQVGGTKTMRPGESARLDQIPAFSGTYTIQGMVFTGVAGTYTFTVD